MSITFLNIEIVTWFLLGVTVFMLFFTLFLYIQTRERSYIFYTLNLLFLILYILRYLEGVSAYFTNYFDINTAELFRYTETTIAVTLSGFYFLFLNEFLFKKEGGEKYNFLFYISIICFLFVPIDWFILFIFNDLLLSQKLQTIATPYVGVVFLIMIYFLFTAKNFLAKMFLLSLSFLLIPVILSIIEVTQDPYFDPSSLSTKLNIYSILTLGLMLKYIVFIYAFIYKATETERDKVRFEEQAKFNTEKFDLIQDLDVQKSRFYTNITHEFRTPLTVILGTADSLKNEKSYKNTNKFISALDMIKRNGQKLLRLVNEMLELRKLESGKLELQLIQADIVLFIKYVVESFQSFADEKNISLSVQSKIEKLFMDFDGNKITTIITNLISNALKFSRPGGQINVKIKKIQKDHEAHLQITVLDNGLGIHKRDLKHIFDRFYQAETSHTHPNVGTGIGLALTKELTELMQGSITVKSKLDEGTEFTVLIPIKQSAPRATEVQLPEIPLAETVPVQSSDLLENSQVGQAQTGKPLVLIIEDNHDVAQYIKSCLVDKYNCRMAYDGIAGVEKAYALIPDIIISDVMMPHKDGFQVCTELKNDERTDHIPIIMLTAKATVQDKITGLAQGADAYLVKPFEKSELLTRMEQLILLRKKMLLKFSKTSYSDFLNTNAAGPESKFIKKAVGLIYKNISDSDFGPVQLAQQVSLSESQLFRKLKAIASKSPALFIRSVRLQKARQLLASGELNVAEAAYQSGFNEPSWFSRVFKEEFGITPSSVKSAE